MRKLNSQNSTRNRRGTTLLIVIALLGLLTLLGFVFYTFATQEHSNAENYVEAAKDAKSEPTDAFEYFLRSLIIGSPQGRNNSILPANGYHSLMRNLMGTDARPKNGVGRVARTLIPTPGDNNVNAGLVASPVAFPPDAAITNRFVPQFLPEPDAGYTYADHNNAFLGMVGVAIRQVGTATPTYVPFVKPSFMRPELLRPSLVSPADTPGTIVDPAWQTTGAYAASSFRPNPLHVYINRDGVPIQDVTVSAAKPTRRFLNSADPDDSDEIFSLIGASGGFPFPVDVDGDSVTGEMGIWTDPSASPADQLIYELDVDNMGTGVRDGIWLDLDYPVLEDPDTGAKYTIMFSTIVLDLDGLINLNTGGNLSGLVNFRDGTAPFGGFDTTLSELTPGAGLGGRTGFVSRSNEGLSPSEVNPLWSMMRGHPSTETGSTVMPTETLISLFPDLLEQHGLHYLQSFSDGTNTYPRAFDPAEVANMELLWLLCGRGEFDPSQAEALQDMIVGRWGENSRLYQVLQGIAAGTVDGQQLYEHMPAPGVHSEDDNNDLYEGAFVPSTIRGFGFPLDYTGGGSFVLDTDPRLPLTVQQLSTPSQFQRFNGYSFFDSTPFVTPRGTRYDSLTKLPGFTPAAAPNWTPSALGTGDFGVSQRWLLGNTTAYSGTLSSDDLLTNARINPLLDDPSEVVYDEQAKRNVIDEIFGAEDIPGLFMTNADIGSSLEAVSERLRNLMPYSLDDEEIRQRFTTVSWRLRHFAIRNPFGVNRVIDGGDDDPRAWEFNADTEIDWDGDGNVERGNARLVAGQSPNGLEFPPQFGPLKPYYHGEFTRDPLPNTPDVSFFSDSARGVAVDINDELNLKEDPFRPQLRRMLHTEIGEQKGAFGQLPISTNHLIDVERLPNRNADLLRGVLEYRLLTEHPDISEVTGAVAYPPPNDAASGLPRFPPETIAEREFWARRDRQKLARDIYVLLYTLGKSENDQRVTNGNTTGSNLTIDVETKAWSTPIYTPEECRLMAQFAVNLVDALDRDNVSTKFEYDINLGMTEVTAAGVVPPPTPQRYIGWNLDDNPDTGDLPGDNEIQMMTQIDSSKAPDFPATGLTAFERGVVYGVEKQQLAFSEAMGIHTPILGQDNPATLFNDANDPDGDGDPTTGGRLNLFIELENVQPFQLDLGTNVSTTINSGVWRISWVPVSQTVNEAGMDTAAITFLQNAGTIDAGDRFTIAAADVSQGNFPADYYIDKGLDGNFDGIAPIKTTDLPTASSTPTDPQLQPQTDLDLNHDRDRTASLKFGISDETPDPGEFFTEMMDNVRPGTPPMLFPNGFGFVDLVLQRRANPNLPELPEATNAWVEVDRITVQFRSNNLMDNTDETTSSPTVTELLDELRSRERISPLRRNGVSDGETAGVNTITTTNTNSPAVYSLIQTHPDRDFTSVLEILSLPLYGPESLTSMFAEARKTPDEIATDSANHMFIGSTWSDGNGTNPPDPKPLWRRPEGVGLVSTASAKFLLPEFPDDDTTTTDAMEETEFDNRWYRVLPFLETPTRIHRQIGNPIETVRIPGAVNLNTVRHASVLAGLIDDPNLADLNLAADVNLPVAELVNSTPGADFGDWFQQLILSRDGLFRRTAGGALDETSLWIPGLPDFNFSTTAGVLDTANTSSRPIRSFALPNLDEAYVPAGAKPSAENERLNHTFLRSLPADAATIPPVADNRRRLWEVGNATNRSSSDPIGALMTPKTRNRVLEKIANNTTNQSNAFVVYATIGYFEVYEDPTNGAVRIGGEYDLDQDPTTPLSENYQRAIFVIDRSQVYDAYDAGTGRFDYRKLVKHRLNIQ